MEDFLLQVSKAMVWCNECRKLGEKHVYPQVITFYRFQWTRGRPGFNRFFFRHCMIISVFLGNSDWIGLAITQKGLECIPTNSMNQNEESHFQFFKKGTQIRVSGWKLVSQMKMWLTGVLIKHFRDHASCNCRFETHLEAFFSPKNSLHVQSWELGCDAFLQCCWVYSPLFEKRGTHFDECICFSVERDGHEFSM